VSANQRFYCINITVRKGGYLSQHSSLRRSKTMSWLLKTTNLLDSSIRIIILRVWCLRFYFKGPENFKWSEKKIHDRWNCQPYGCRCTKIRSIYATPSTLSCWSCRDYHVYALFVEYFRYDSSIFLHHNFFYSYQLYHRHILNGTFSNVSHDMTPLYNTLPFLKTWEQLPTYMKKFSTRISLYSINIFYS